MSNHLVCLLRRSEKVSCFGKGRPVNAPSFSQSCVPVSVERVDKDEDADENVDADQTRTARPVESEQSIS